MKSGRTVRSREGDVVTVARMFLRGVMQGRIDAVRPATYKETATLLNHVWQEIGLHLFAVKEWKYDDVNNAIRGLWEPGALLFDGSYEPLLQELCKVFDADYESVYPLLFSAEVFQRQAASVARDVAIAILNGPGLGIEPFVDLADRGALPTRSRILDHFGDLVSGIDAVGPYEFPDKRSAPDREIVNQFFRRAGLSASDAQAATRAVIQRRPRSIPSGFKPNKTCLHKFLQALYRPDVTPAPITFSKVVDRLERFGLEPIEGARVRWEKFVPNTLARTSRNRFQIKLMAEVLKLEPEPYYDVLFRRG